MRKHSIPLVLVEVLSLGCASLGSAPDRPYRVSGMHADSAPAGTMDQGGFVLKLDGGVEYAVQVSESSGVVSLRTTLRNHGPQAIRYDPQRALARLRLGDAVEIGGRDVSLTLRLEQVRR